MNEDDKPPLPSSPPPEPIELPRRVNFSLTTESPLYDFNLVTSSRSSTSSPSPALFVGSEYRFSPSSPGIPLIPDDKPSYYESIFLPASSSNSWTYPASTTPTPPPMLVEESLVKNGRPLSPRSIANSLDSLSECAQHHSDVVNGNTNSSNTDRSRSLGDLLSATNQDGSDPMRNGSYDTLVSKSGGLTDSGIGAGLLIGGMRDEMDMEDNASSSSPDRIPTDISSPDSYSYPAVSFASYDPVLAGSVASYSNENTNPLDSSSRGHSSDDRKHNELPAISEESEHEQSIHIPYNYPQFHQQEQQPHASSVGPLPSALDHHREVVEHTYPMVHCKSAPSANAFINNNIEHRRVVSDDVTEITRLKRSEEMENMDKIGRISFEKRSSSTHNLKKGRCKSAMIVFQGDPDDRESEDDDEVDGYSKDNEMLILDKGGADDRYRSPTGSQKKGSPLRHYDNHSNLPSISSAEPPPVRIHRKVSAASSSRVSPSYKASDQSWKDKMPPFGMVGHTMYSPQSLPTRDAVPRSPFDVTSGTVSAGGSQRLSSLELTTPDGRGGGATSQATTETDNYTTPPRPGAPRSYHHHHHHTLPSPPALLATSEVTENLMPLSEICNQNRFSTISSSTNTDASPPKSQTGTPNNSFVRRSLRKIMKRTSVSTTALNVGVGDDGLRSGSLKRRASNASAGFFASAQAHLKPRPKSLKKQSWMCTSMLLGGAVTSPVCSGEEDEKDDAYFPSASFVSSFSLSPSLSVGKSNKKEKSGSDTFTFGNLFRRRPNNSRPNLADIISDLDQRSTTSRQMSAGGSLSVGATNRRSTSATILPMSGGGLNDPTAPFESSSLDGLPDHISRMVSPSDNCHASSSNNINGAANARSNLYTQLERLYGKYDLFENEEYQSWHEKYRHNTLSTKQIKKQDAIYELFLMEKRHCANIAFLLQGYRRRMLEENIISKQEMDVLIPDVLEPLLIFHLNVLERLNARINEESACEVGTISDIISEELAIDGGQHTKLCCDAYTDFGVAKEQSDVLYHHLMNKNAKFSEFFKRTYSEEPFYKRYDFRPLITKIIGRATKYSLLLETILKNEQQFSEHHDLTKTALETARKFAHKIDENLSMAHMSMKWEEIKVQIDPSSSTNLYVSDPSVPNGTIRYNFDLESLNAATNRKLVHLGEALIKVPNMPGSSGGTHSSSSSGKQTDKKDQCFIVLFDDIIVILIRKSARQLIFMPDQGAMPVQSLLIRTAARGHSIMLISGAKPVLFEISFSTATDRKKWVAHLEAAPKNVPPEGIRITTGDVDGVIRDRVAAQQELEDQWLKRLEELFATRIPEEDTLANYLETRLDFFDEVRAHIHKLPFKRRTDISSRVREAVKSRFRELRRVRVIPLNKLVERMSESRDADLWSFFDEKADASDVLDKFSDLSDDSDNSGDSVVGRTKPRRIQTFHGTSQPQGSNGISETKNNGIRRHTTVPRMNSDGGTASTATPSSATDRAPIDEVVPDEDETSTMQTLSARAGTDTENDRKTYATMVAKLPIRQTAEARKASTDLIKEVISLRRENNLLKSDNALTKSRCALLERVRGGGAMMTSTATAVDESMEMLRKKEKEIREMQRKMLAEREDLLEKQKAVDAQELEVQSKWAALQSRSNEQPVHTRSSSTHSSQVSSPTYKTPQQQLPLLSQNGEWSPVLTSLATKTETKKLKK